MLRNAFGGLSRSGAFTFKPGAPYVERHITPGYRERSVDTDLGCPACGFQFKVFGLFGFCPKCRTENAQIYDTNLAIIRQELAKAPDQHRALRYAYTDLVSAMEMFCKNKQSTAVRLAHGRRADGFADCLPKTPRRYPQRRSDRRPFCPGIARARSSDRSACDLIGRRVRSCSESHAKVDHRLVCCWSPLTFAHAMKEIIGWFADFRKLLESMTAGPVLFRGQANALYPLVPGIGRAHPDYVATAELERKLFQAFKRQAASHTGRLRLKSDWDWLILGQHHGLKVRGTPKVRHGGWVWLDGKTRSRHVTKTPSS
jgi:hypothetical protein